MKYLPLVLAALLRKPLRSVLTGLSVAVAFLLFGVLEAINAGFDEVIQAPHLDRLLTDPRVPGGAPMPISAADKIKQVPGVIRVCARAAFFGSYQDPKNGIFALATDAADWLGVRPEYSMPKEQLEALREAEYTARSSKPLHRMLNLLAYSIGSIMAIGALFGALNSMYSAASARSNEIATLRALGFDSITIVASVLVEALLLTLIGALAGTLIALLGFNGRAINMIGSNRSPSQLVYELAVTPESIGIAFALAVLLGLIGGLLPAVRATRVPIAVGLRSR